MSRDDIWSETAWAQRQGMPRKMSRRSPRASRMDGAGARGNHADEVRYCVRSEARS
jgi:hypothetical protein